MTVYKMMDQADEARYKCGIWLSDAVGSRVKRYFPRDCQRLIYDWVQLKNLIRASETDTQFSDYSFSIAPMYKAMEGIFWKIAKNLNLIKEDQPLGNLFNEKEIDGLFRKIDEKIDNFEKIDELKSKLKDIKYFLKRYRHRPSHYEQIITSFEKAELIAFSALNCIGELIEDLMNQELILKPKEQNYESGVPF